MQWRGGSKPSGFASGCSFSSDWVVCYTNTIHTCQGRRLAYVRRCGHQLAIFVLMQFYQTVNIPPLFSCRPHPMIKLSSCGPQLSHFNCPLTKYLEYSEYSEFWICLSLDLIISVRKLSYPPIVSNVEKVFVKTCAAACSRLEFSTAATRSGQNIWDCSSSVTWAEYRGSITF